MAQIWNGLALPSLLLSVSFPLTFIVISALAMESTAVFGIHPLSKLKELAYEDFATARHLKSLLKEQCIESLPFLKLANRLPAPKNFKMASISKNWGFFQVPHGLC